MTSKRGVSDLVTTVLLVLMTIVAVGILYASVMPLIRQNIETSKQCNDIALEVKTDGGYTCYNVGEVQIQVGRGASDLTLYGIQLGVSGMGVSKQVSVYDLGKYANVRQINETAYNTFIRLPLKNEASTYIVNGASLGITTFEKVSATPILKMGTKEITCPLLTSVSVSKC